MISRNLSVLGLLLMVGGSFVEGATTHLGAWVFRIGACVWCLTVSERTARERLGDVWLFLLAVVLLGYGTLHADQSGRALQSLVSAFFVGALFVAALSASSEARLSFCRVMLLGALGHVAWAVAQRWQGHGRAAGGFFDPNHLAAFLVPLVVMSVHGYRHKPWWALGAVGALLLGILASDSRSGLAAAVLILGLLMALRGKRQAVLAALGLILVAALLPALSPRWRPSYDPHGYARLQIWKASLEIAWLHPEGVGLADSEPALRIQGVRLPGVVHYPKTARQAHNEFLTALVELGFAGGLYLLLLVVVVFRRAVRTTPAATPAATHVCMLLSFILPAMFSDTLHAPPVAALLAVWAAWLWGERHSLPPREARGGGLGWGAVGPVPLLLACSILPWLTTIPDLVASRATLRSTELRARGDEDGAYQAALSAALWAPWNVPASLLLLSIEHAQGLETATTIRELKKLSDESPAATQPIERAVALLEAQADPDRTLLLSLRTELTQRDPKNALVWVALARAYLRFGEVDEAIAQATRAVELEPHCAKAHALLAELAGDEERAAAHRAARDAAAALAPQFEGRARAILTP